MSYYISFNLLF